MERKSPLLMTLSAGGLAALLSYEGFRAEPYLPNPHDRPTIGYGTTFYPDGSPVKLTDPPVDKKTAQEYARVHISKDEKVLQETVGHIPLNQNEYDAYVDFIYQYGRATWKNSSMVRNLYKGDYLNACNSLLLYRKIRVYDKSLPKGYFLFDCSTPQNKICYGVWDRQVKRHARCIEENILYE